MYVCVCVCVSLKINVAPDSEACALQDTEWRNASGHFRKNVKGQAVQV